uniref:CN hydrolase domain-containing protein n=1 Tax=Heterorhabditis bacteriophora TaxID=37862 RepID=A0A1I7XHB4_HETBA
MVSEATNKIGERLSLDLGPNIKTWTRTRGGANEFIMYCGPTEKNIRCTQFVMENGSVATPNSYAQVAENGTLIIDPFLASDVGEYFSPDEMERVSRLANEFF